MRYFLVNQLNETWKHYSFIVVNQHGAVRFPLGEEARVLTADGNSVLFTPSHKAKIALADATLRRKDIGHRLMVASL